MKKKYHSHVNCFENQYVNRVQSPTETLAHYNAESNINQKTLISSFGWLVLFDSNRKQLRKWPNQLFSLLSLTAPPMTSIVKYISESYVSYNK